MKYKVVEQNLNIDQSTGSRTDKIVMLTIPKSKGFYPQKLRLVEYYDSHNDELLVFPTNNFDISTLEITNLYKNHWQFKVLFK
ncbi:MAG: hypothetical protein QM751_07155 [Paludibacteraceae bacterium]